MHGCGALQKKTPKEHLLQTLTLTSTNLLVQVVKAAHLLRPCTNTAKSQMTACHMIKLESSNSYQLNK